MKSIKRIADAVHGTVELTELEGRIISTRAYQRLRGVKHLGLASLVFPGADYSRFAHGVGTCHVMGLTVDSLNRNVDDALSPEEVQLYRVAALLHDIGHYPYSHTFERALKNYYSEINVLKPAGTPDHVQDGAEGTGVTPPANWLHEELGTHVIREDEELSSLLSEYAVDIDQLVGAIVRADPPKYANLVSSDLDADRTDYLMRTALHTGLPYGNVDLPYLLSQIRIDGAGNVCYTSKGMRAAEHLLLSRYFDYQQVSYHKTVAGLEEVLNDAVGALLRSGALSCRPEDLTAMISDGRWYHFDDAYITALIRKADSTTDVSDTDRLLFRSILERRPPKLVADREALSLPESAAANFASLESLARQKREAWVESFKCPVYIWTKAGSGLTKIGPQIPVGGDEGAEEETYDKVHQAVHILHDEGTASVPIQRHPRSLISVLSPYGLYSLRVYVLLPADREAERPAIAARVNADLGGFFKSP